jgi:hypothetical protein
MEQKEFFEGFSDEKQQEYLQEIRERYGDRSVRETLDRWNSYMPEQKEAIQASGEAIFRGICDHMVNGYDSPEVQQLIKALHKHMGFFYECSYERFEGLGHLYNEHPEFKEMYKTKFHPDMPEFLEKAIVYYCKNKTTHA